MTQIVFEYRRVFRNTPPESSVFRETVQRRCIGHLNWQPKVSCQNLKGPLFGCLLSYSVDTQDWESLDTLGSVVPTSSPWVRSLTPSLRSMLVFLSRCLRPGFPLLISQAFHLYPNRRSRYSPPTTSLYTGRPR